MSKEETPSDHFVDGTYDMTVTLPTAEGTSSKMELSWTHGKTKTSKVTCTVHPRFAETVNKFVHKEGVRSGYTIRGYNCVKNAGGDFQVH